MKLETAIELIKEAQKIEKNYTGSYFDIVPDEISKKKHDECLHIARSILLEHYYERKNK